VHPKTLVVFSHLRWNFVFQRPQHLLSRLAAHYRVLFIEEPIHDGGKTRLEISAGGPGVSIIRPRTPLHSPGFADDQLNLLGPMVAELLAGAEIGQYIVWFYTPLALPLLEGLQPRAIVYDCMDELSAFAGAPPQLREREAQFHLAGFFEQASRIRSVGHEEFRHYSRARRACRMSPRRAGRESPPHSSVRRCGRSRSQYRQRL